MSDALATRIVNMNTGLDQFQDIQEEISNLYNTVEVISLESEKTNNSIVAFKDDISAVLERLQSDLSLKYEESLTEQIDSYNNLQDRFSTINSRMLSLENAFEEASEADLIFFTEMKRLENFVNQIDALILLEKEKYLNQIRLSQQVMENEENNLNNDPMSFER
jgi:predicted  nucleic acid-binding Zn-ribbon protein